MNLQQAYKTLDLNQGAEWESIRSRHRTLVKKWHPDKYQNINDQKLAHDKIIKINSAYAYLRKVKYHSGVNISAQNSTVNQKTTAQNSTYDFTFYSETKKKESTKEKDTNNNRVEFKQKKIDYLFSTFTKTRNQTRIKKNRAKSEFYFKKKIAEEQNYWKKLRQAYDARTRLGLYRSFLNAVLFGRFIYFQKPSTNSLSGRISLRDKYEIDIRHNLIQDKIFYSVNKGFNLLLKYLFGGFYIIMFLYFISIHFSNGKAYFLEEFLGLQLFVLSQVFFLFFPDNIFQRAVLWKYRHLEKKAISETFTKNNLPGKFQFYKHIMLLGKYSTLLISLGLFFWLRRS
ncbi:MAG: J domain-containing protein [Bacteroidetes bacterium]|nr:J domain-containing protein [Bacteroidota bacterium]